MKNEFINSLPWICSQNFVVISSERYRARDSNSTNLAKRFLGNCQAAKYSPALANSPVFNQECISRNFVAGRFQFYGLYYEISRARNVYRQRTIPSHLTLIVIKRLLGKISSRRTRRNILSRRKLIFFLLLRVEIFSPLIIAPSLFQLEEEIKGGIMEQWQRIKQAQEYVIVISKRLMKVNFAVLDPN